MQRFVGKGHLMQRWDTCRTAFLCCDIQDRLRNHIPNFQDAVEVSNSMTDLQRMLGDEHSVYIATEQAPKGLGPIAKDIKLPPSTPPPFGKTQPSMLTPEVLPYIIGDESRGLKPVQQAILWGHETHVCVVNTADDLLSRGIRVALLVDGCGTQRAIDHDVSIMTMAAWEGLVLTTRVGVTMQLTKGNESMMKEVLRLAKEAARMSKDAASK